MALNEALVGIGVAAKAGDFSKAWALRRAAWGYSDLLPPGKTRRQRQQLGLYKELLLAAQKAKRERA